MRKLLKSMKTLLLVAAGLCVGTNSAWAGTSTWTYSTTLEENTFGTAFQGSTSGLVNVTLGTAEQASNWQINQVGQNSTKFGLNNETDQKTYDETNTNVPTGGTFMAVTPVVDVNFSVTWRSYDNLYVYLVNGETNAKTQLVRAKNTQTTNCGKLTAGTTYYIYADSEERDFSFQGFSASTITSYTINYKYNDETIASETDVESYDGAKVSPANQSVWSNETKYYVDENATTEFTVQDGTNTFDVALRLAATDAVASVNAVDANGTVLATFNGPTGIEGESYDGYVFYTRAVFYNGQYYAVDASNGNGNNYGKNGLKYGTPGTVTYTLDNTISYYAEAENLNKSRNYAASGNVPERASGGNWYRPYASSHYYSTALTAGVYTLEVSARNQGSKNTESYVVKVRTSDGTLGDAVGTLSWGVGNNSVQTLNYILVPTGASVAICETTGYNSNVCLDYIILRKRYDVTDASKIVGALDFTSEANSVRSADYTMKKGDVKVFTFKNHGQDFGKNWRIEVKEGETWKSNTCADFFDYTLNKHLSPTNGAEDWNVMSTDGGNSLTGINWDSYKSDMDNANVVATLTYGANGTLIIDAVSTGTNPGNKYYVHNEVADLTNDLTINLSVNNSWLEVLSVEQTAVGVTTTAAGKGWATLYTDKGMDFSGVEGLTAYTASLDNYTVTLNKVNDIQAGTGVVLKSSTTDANTTYSIPVFASSETAKGDMKGSTTEAKDATQTPIYILKLNANNEAQFMRATKGSLAAGKAYLPAGNGGAKALTVVFANDPTGIATVNAAETAQPVKRIVNGQLVIEKNGKRYNAAGAEF